MGAILAKDLISAKQARGGGVTLPPEALKELKALLTYNDSLPTHVGRVGREGTMCMLESYGVKIGRTALESLCRSLGRKSWARP